jgi:thiamine-monophosphate kinase
VEWEQQAFLKDTHHKKNEEYFIEKYLKPLSKKNESFPISNGDDCSIINFNSLISVDSFVEGQHFPKDLDPFFIGYRSIAVAASDILAMGAKPEGCLLSITINKPSEKWFKKFSNGVGEFLSRHQMSLIGGDLTKGNLNIGVTVIGKTNNKILKRDGAKVNENIFISGSLGRGYLGRLKYKQADTKLNHYLMPKIPLHNIDTIREVASSCIDISDGFLIDLKRILTSSKVGADIFLNENFCTNGTEDLICGDDYVLCFTSNLDAKDLTKILPDSYYVGKIKKEQKLNVYDQKKNKLNFNQSGWDSFI